MSNATGLKAMWDDAWAQQRAKSAASAKDVREWDPPTWVAFGSIAIVVALTVMVGWNSRAFVFQADEVGVMANAWAMTHADGVVHLYGGGYMPGTSILLVPLWFFFSDFVTMYPFAIAVEGAIGIAGLWPLYLLAKKCGVTRNAALVLASLVEVAPAKMLHGNYVMSEHLVMFAFVVLVIAGINLAREVSVRHAVLFGLASGFVFISHGRTLAVVAVAGLALLAATWRHWRVALAGIGAYVVSVGGAWALYTWIMGRLYFMERRSNQTLNALLDQTPMEVLNSTASQAWVQMAGWSFPLVIGMVVLATRARKGDDVAWARWLLGALGAVFIFMVLTNAGNGIGHLRLDVHVYERYLDAFSPAVVIIGLAVFVKQFSARMLKHAVVVVGVLTVAFAALTVPNIVAGGQYVPVHVFGIAHFMNPSYAATDHTDPWLVIAVVVAVMALGLMALSQLRFHALALALLGLYFVTSVVVTDQAELKPAEMRLRHEESTSNQYATVDPEIPLGADYNNETVFLSHNVFVYYEYPRQYIAFDGENEPRPSDMVRADWDWQVALDEGARPIIGSTYGDSVVWVFPGALQDQLDAEGRLFTDGGGEG